MTHSFNVDEIPVRYGFPSGVRAVIPECGHATCYVQDLFRIERYE
jgi:hypothetical protein